MTGLARGAAPTLGWRVRLDVAGRVLVSVVGGYGVAALTTGLLARHLPMRPAEAVTAATLSSFAVYAAVIVLAFQARRSSRVWMGIVAGNLVLGGLLWLSIGIGGRL